ncbi:MAG TPA: TolC family protein [Cytophagaceae bacterium]|jgi:cobalt-zinc-cadmium efflux system outer membrane protein|nr:TolC family protein [Cytophagaceae bacterium]
MKNNIRYIILKTLVSALVSLPFYSGALFAQIDTSFNHIKISYPEYLSLVGKNNLSYAAEKFNLNIAEARIETAKIFPDPQLGFGWFDNGQRRLNMGYGYSSGMGWLLELGGKRKARIDLAKSETELTGFLLQNYFRNLRADATLSYLFALQNKLLLDVQLNSYQSMNQLAKSDSIRFKLGSITKVDALQSKLEAGTMLNNVFAGEAQWKVSLIDLSFLLGKKQTDTLIYPNGDFSKFTRDFNLLQLITAAQNNRADLLAALQNKTVSQNILKLAKANRVIDLGINTGFTYASYDRNIIAPTPSFTQVNGGISIPLKFSNNHPGELKAAYYSGLQAEAQYKQIELQIQIEITQAYYNYLAAQKQVQQYNSGLLSEAKAVLDGKKYSYIRGETSLLEVLNAQRTYNNVQQNYFQTLYNYGATLVELERAAGIWDVNF